MLSLYLFETYLTKNSIKPEINKAEIIKKKINYDSRSKFEFYNDMIANDKNITVTVAPIKFNDPDKKIHFLSGISNSKTIDCNENGYYSSYLSDRFGFNNPNDQWDNKIIQYVLLGDSFTHGACVNRPNDIASQLRILSKNKVINLGYKANGPLSMLATLKEYMPRKSRNVLWLYFEGNDLSDLKSELKNEILIKYYFDENYRQNLRFKQKLIDQINQKIMSESIKLEDRIVQQAIKNSEIKNKILKFIRLNETKKALSLIFIKQKKKELPIEEFKNIIKSVKKYTENNNSKLHFIYLPQFERYKKRFSNLRYDQIKKIIEDLNINFIDLNQGVFLKQEDPLALFPFKMWGHYNEEGYKKVAYYIYENLKQSVD